jgi:hypothetical protein
VKSKASQEQKDPKGDPTKCAVLRFHLKGKDNSISESIRPIFHCLKRLARPIDDLPPRDCGTDFNGKCIAFCQNTKKVGI